MQSQAADVDGYLSGVPEHRRGCLTAVRELCRTELAGFTESMDYRMPSYSRDGVVEVAFTSQKQYISLFVLRTDVMAAHREQLTGLSVGKGCIRYRRPEQVDLDLVRGMLRDTAASTGPVC